MNGEHPTNGDRLARAFEREEQSGLIYALWGRLLVLALLAIYLLLAIPLDRSLGYTAVIGVFMVLGAIPHLLRRWGLRSFFWTAAFTLLDVALLTYLLVTPPPFSEIITPQLNLRLPNFLYLGVFLVGMALSYSPALVIWAGVAAIIAWSAGIVWIVSLPDSFAYSSVDIIDRGVVERRNTVEVLLDPNFVSLTQWYNQVIFLALITIILAITVWRSRRLVKRQVTAESERASLSRYFSPNIVDNLTREDARLDQVRNQKVAVLFADMVGFTAASEKLSPEEVVALLRDFHGRLARTVFEHGGTLDKYMGDAVMAHFGTPNPGDDDATRAFACAASMVREIADWNAERTARGEAPIKIGIGVHYGPCVVGNIGDERRLEYTVLGDTVNVASRLERLTRTRKTPLVVSEALVRAIRQEDQSSGRDLLKALKRDRARTVRGRATPVGTWLLDETRLENARRPTRPAGVRPTGTESSGAPAPARARSPSRG